MSAEPFVLEQLSPRGEIVGAGAGPTERAAEIIANARARATDIEAEAREAGLEIGRVEGRELAAAEVAMLRASLVAAVAAVDAARAEFVAAAELEAVDLAVQIAEKIVGAALELEPERVCDVVAGALRRIVDRDRVVLDLNPDDVDLVRAWLDGGAAEWGAIEIHAERRVPRGGCIARTAEGEIDARPSEQLTRVAELLRDTFAARTA